MHLLSVNIGQEQTIPNARPTSKTGISKSPAHGPVQIARLGIPEDAICDTENHGGVDQAIYIY